jgi:hypothetical protein
VKASSSNPLDPRILPSNCPAEADHGREERQSVTKPTAQQNTELSTSQRLWNAAYNNLENNNDTAKLVNTYGRDKVHVSSGEHPLIPGIYQVVSAWRAPYDL